MAQGVGEELPPHLRDRGKQELLAKKQDIGENSGGTTSEKPRGECLSLQKEGMANIADFCQDGQ